MVNEIIWRVKSVLSTSIPHFIFFWIIRNKELLVTKKHDLLIEGFPRSGNTYLVALVNYYFKERFNIAHHRHEVGQLRYAAKHSIPTIVVIRDPVDSITSFVIRENVSFKFALSLYMSIMNEIMKNRSFFLIIEFNNLIQDQSETLKRISEFLKVTPNRYLFTSRDDELIKSNVRNMEKFDSGANEIRNTHLALPSSSRENLKAEYTDVLNRDYRPQLEQCIDIYSNLRNKESL